MFTKIGHSWRLIGICWQVLRHDRELIVFPILSSLALFLVTAVFFIPFAPLLSTVSEQSTAAAGAKVGFGEIVLLFLYYFACYTVIIFANSALIGAALIRLRGGDPTLRDGFRIASQRSGAILGYALIAATVGTLLHLLDSAARSRESNIVMRIIAAILSSLFSIAWSLMTYLVVPVLVVEKVGPIEAIKRSGGLLRRTWGEQVVGNISFGLVTFLLFLLAALLLALPAGLIISILGPALGVLLAVLLYILVLGAFLMISNALSGIYQAALYLYATEGVDVPHFNRHDLEGAFRPKN